jgi:hypothetical protein
LNNFRITSEATYILAFLHNNIAGQWGGNYDVFLALHWIVFNSCSLAQVVELPLAAIITFCFQVIFLRRYLFIKQVFWLHTLILNNLFYYSSKYSFEYPESPYFPMFKADLITYHRPIILSLTLPPTKSLLGALFCSGTSILPFTVTSKFVPLVGDFHCGRFKLISCNAN